MVTIGTGEQYERGSGRYKLLSIRQVQRCIVQHEKYSQYIVTSINGKHPLICTKN